MKTRKITALLLALILLLSIAACGKGHSNKDEEETISSSSDISSSAGAVPTSGPALPTTVVIPGNEVQTTVDVGSPDSILTIESAVTEPASIPEDGTLETVAAPEQQIPAEAELYMFADASTRRFDSPDELPLTAYEEEEFWYAMEALCVGYREYLGGDYHSDSNEIYYSADKISDFASVMFSDYSETPPIPDGIEVREADGGYLFDCDTDVFAPAELVGMEEVDNSVILTLKIVGGDLESGNDIYRYVRLFEADNQFGLAVSNVRTEIAE